jgi:hypothetical protein
MGYGKGQLRSNQKSSVKAVARSVATDKVSSSKSEKLKDATKAGDAVSKPQNRASGNIPKTIAKRANQSIEARGGKPVKGLEMKRKK